MATLLLLLLSVAAVAMARAHGESLDVLQAVGMNGALPPMVVVAASFGGTLPTATRMPDASVAALRLVSAQLSDDCSRVETAQAVPLSAASAVLLDRGGSCSFVQKAAVVQRAGAALLVVGDTVQGAYASAKQSGEAIYNCALGLALVPHNATSLKTYPSVESEEEGLATCTQSSGCAAATCVYTGATGSHGQRFQVCCFANSLVRMGVDAPSLTLASTITIPAVFVALRDAQHLRRLVQEEPTLSVQAFNAQESLWNVSMLLTWLLGVSVVIGGAYCSATDERQFSYEKVAYSLSTPVPGRIETQYMSIGDTDQPTHRNSAAADGEESAIQDERLELAPIHALYFVIGSSSILVLLYYGHLAMLMNVLFMVATTASMTQIVILPVLVSVRPLRSLPQNVRDWLLPLVSVLLAASISVYWFLHRASASIWPLQDLLCITLCFVIIDSIQLPSLKVATILLGLAFAYDIFFVYLSPLVFGSSVMIDVASGADHIQASADAQASQVHEKLPMVLSVPLLFSYYGGDALLGLGDLILPGLLVSLCIRYDYCMGYPLSRNYFMVAGTSYAAGLLLANFMAIALRDIVEGQPALMYIVPIMLGSVALLASRHQELDKLWEGPECLRMEHGLALGLATERPPRRDEVDPFLKKR